MIRVNQTTIEKIWRRLAQESRSPFLLRIIKKIWREKIWRRSPQESRPPFLLPMEDAEFTAIDLYCDFGIGYVLRSDGVIVKWSIEWNVEATSEYEVELDPGWCVSALVIGAKRIPELKEALPVRPTDAQDCVECDGHGFTGPPNAPKFILCQTCWGLGWCT